MFKLVFIFRSHFNFLEDYLDGLILAAFYQHWGIASTDQCPTRNKPPRCLLVLSEGDRLQWLMEVVQEVSAKMYRNNLFESVNSLRSKVSLIEENDMTVTQCCQSGVYECPACGSRYKKKSSMQQHLIECGVIANVPNNVHILEEKPKTLCSLLFLLRDLADAYKLGDGNRIMLDIKLALLYFFDTGHTKYRLWMWRMVAYVEAILTCRKSYEFKWNMCCNLLGGIDGNIADDNLVEIHVKLLKQMLRAQGPNVTYKTAQMACNVMQFIDKMKRDVVQACNVAKRNSRKSTNKSEKKNGDVLTIATECLRGVNECEQGKDLIRKIDAKVFYTWCKKQVCVADRMMT